jgi:copper(I)-binding protein
MRFSLTFLAAGLFALGLAVPASAQNVTAGALEIAAAWTRATPPGAEVGGGYMTITNKGTEPDTLLGGSTPVAGKVELHQMSMQDGVMHMSALPDGLEIGPGATVTLDPGGYHLMLMHLKAPLKEGTEVPATLDFAKAGKVAVTLTVEGIGAKAPGGTSGMENMDTMGGANNAMGQ